MPLTLRLITFTILLLSLYCQAQVASNKQISATPKLQLAQTFNTSSETPLNQYWVSEKLDGVRALWDGNQLISKQGHVFTPPPRYTQSFPEQSLDGELWIARQSFEKVSATVRSHRSEKIDAEWKNIKFMVFDLPDSPEIFSIRLKLLHELLSTPSLPSHIQMIKQFRIHSMADLESKLNDITTAGGEGLMLHRQTALYRAGRSANVLKFKAFQDAEATVIDYSPGQGKYKGMTGALIVKLTNGRVLKLGSGLSDKQRQSPPIIGSTITYRYNGYSNHGLPRFARFLRVREEL